MGLSPLTGLCGLVCVGCPLPACPQMPTEVGMSRDCLHPSSLPSGFGWSLVGAGRRGALGSLIPACAATQAFPEVLTALRSRYRRPEKNGARAMDRGKPQAAGCCPGTQPAFIHSQQVVLGWEKLRRPWLPTCGRARVQGMCLRGKLRNSCHLSRVTCLISQGRGCRPQSGHGGAWADPVSHSLLAPMKTGLPVLCRESKEPMGSAT